MVKRKASCLSFDSAEDLPIDLIFHILHENVGLYTFARARQVNRAWAAACDDEKLILSVARYTDGLTRTQFRGLLRLTKEQATSFSSSSHTTVRPYKQSYWLYNPATVQKALSQLGGMPGIQARRVPHRGADYGVTRTEKRPSEFEEFLHERAEKRRRVRLVCEQEARAYLAQMQSH